MAETVVVAGALAQKPGRGGHTWVFLQYLLGLRRLGWDRLVLDPPPPEMCADAAGRPCALEQSANLRYLLDVLERFDLSGRFALLYDRGERFVGLSRPEVLERTRRSACLFNAMGFLDDEEILGCAAKR